MRIIQQSAVSLILMLLSMSLYAQGTTYLEEVIVTAQKRAQSAQTIPVTVTALDTDALTKFGVTDVFDLQNSTPGLFVSQNQTATTSNFSIRGIGTAGTNFGLESSVGLYVDGVYRARQSSIVNELVDVEKLEVLRGPQGTLFGRNTPSGAILINTAAPSHEEGGYIEATIGNYDLFSANGALTGSLVEDVLAYRATVFGATRDGFVDLESRTRNEDDLINDRDRKGGRFQLLYTPNDEFSARLIADYAEVDEVCCAAVTLRNNTFGFGGRPGSDLILTGFGGNIISENRIEDFVMSLNKAPVSKSEDGGLSLELNWDAWGGTITAISALRRFDTFDDIDGDFSDVAIFERTNDAEQESFSQEIRFAKDGEKVDYIVGAYYFTQELDSFTVTTPTTFFGPFVSFSPDIQRAIAGFRAATGGAIPLADPYPPGTSARDTMQQDHDAYAIFGQLDWDISDQLTATLGLRYTEEEKELRGRFDQDNLGPVFNPLIPQTIATLAFPGWGYAGFLDVLSDRPDIDETLEDDQVTGTAKLAYSPDDETLYFISYSTGYKSGGTNTDRINPAFDPLFDAETSKAIEVGMKKDFPDQNLRLNVTLHATDTDDLQTNSFAGNGFNLTNAGEVEAKGAEIEFWWYPSETLRIAGAAVFSEVEYKNYDGANCQIATPFFTGMPDPGAPIVNNVPDTSRGCDRSGESIQQNPEEVFMLSATKDLQLGGMQAYIHGDFSYRAEQFIDGNNDPLKVQDSYSLLNLRAGLYLDDEQNSELSVWVRNVTDEFYYLQGFDVPLQDGKINVYPGEPRTFGVTLRKTF